MSNTPNLDIPLVETQQLQPEVTMNTAIVRFEDALTETLDVECDDGTNVVSAEAVRENMHLRFTAGTISGACTVELPAIKRLLTVTNDTGEAVTVVCAGAGSGAAEAEVPDGTTRILYCDGTQVLGMTSEGMVSVVSAIPIACSDETTPLTAGTAKVTFRMPFAFTLTAVRASVTTAPTGSAVQVDINEAGSSILSTKLTIDATEKTSTTAATPAVISDSSLADDAEITIDIDAVGSTIAGAGLKVYLVGRPT